MKKSGCGSPACPESAVKGVNTGMCGTAHCQSLCFHWKRLWSGSEYTSNILPQQKRLTPNGIRAVGISELWSRAPLGSRHSTGISRPFAPASTKTLSGSWEIHALLLILSGSSGAIKIYHNEISEAGPSSCCGFDLKHLQWTATAFAHCCNRKGWKRFKTLK